jgi:hypothetical protein
MEELLILTGPDRENARHKVEKQLHVVHEASPYVMTVTGDAKEITAISSSSSSVITGSHLKPNDPDDSQLVSQLTQTEQMFIDGWLYNRQSREKKRIGEGLKWDTPGFEPP